jgi:hypothetical protein
MKFSFWDFLTGLFLLATLAVIGVVAIIYFNPYSSLNPFPYPTMPPTLYVPTATATPFSMPPTWTPTPKVDVTPSP